MADRQPSIVALIPARAGSKRVADKNIRPLAGHPLIAYTISSALQSQIFSAVIVSTDSQLYGDIAGHYGAEVPHLRPSELAGDLSPDIEWVEYTLRRLQKNGRDYDCFSIFRGDVRTIQESRKKKCSENLSHMDDCIFIHHDVYRSSSSLS